jgi:hypothetical protein
MSGQLCSQEIQSSLFICVLVFQVQTISVLNLLYSRCWIKNGFSISEFQKYLGHDYKRKRGELETCSQEREPVHAKRSAGE